MVLTIAGFHPRSFSVKAISLGIAFTFIVFLYLSSGPSTLSSIIPPKTPYFGFATKSRTCPPRAYANGKWTGPHYRTDARIMTNKSQALAFAGFEGCASSREFDWHLASDTEKQWDRFPDAQSYRWTVGKEEDGCGGLLELDKEQMVRDLVQQGGWLLVGDSITEGHFFSLSCILFPHVIATPKYTPNSYFDRAWPQNLYLNPESPLLRPSSGTHRQLRIPPGFIITSTPLVTFRRIDLLFRQTDLEELHHSLHPRTRPHFSLFSEEAAWSLGPKDYMPLFFNGSYSTMVVSTAGHWTTTLFGGYGKNETAAFRGAKLGIDGVIEFFGHVMRQWADEVQGALWEAAKHDRGRRKRQVVVRAYLPGHEDCHSHREPWTEVQPMKWNWYNWGRIWEFNDVFENVLTHGAKKYPDIHYLAIERPGRLRPDAHATGDCLHIMAGAGVLEGWSHYIWHFVSKELGRSRHSRVNA